MISWRITHPLYRKHKWRLNSNVDDYIGTADGTATSLTYSENSFGKSAGLFDGANSKVVVSNNTNLQTLFDFGGSISVWVRADSDGEGDAGRIISKSNQYVLEVANEATGAMDIQFTYNFSGNDGVWITTATELDVATERHIVLTYDNRLTTNDPILYVDGKAVALTESTTPTNTPASNSNDFCIGNVSGSSATFDGLIWDVTPYTGLILTGDEVKQVWNMEKNS